MLLVFHLLLLSVITFAEKKLLDMSYEYVDESNTYYYWPEQQFTRKAGLNKQNGLQDDGSWYEDYTFCSGEHGGTHIDSPRHGYKDKWTLEQIPLSRLVDLPAVKVDMADKAQEDNKYQVRVSDLEDWEKKHGKIPEGGVVFLHFGWEQYYPNRTTFLGIQNSTHNYPAFHPDAATWLGEKRGIYGVGVDGPSLDNSETDAGVVSHWNFFKQNLWGLEVVAGVGKLPATGARVTILPMKIRGGSGAPTRVYAVWDTETSGCTSLHTFITTLLIICLAVVLLQV